MSTSVDFIYATDFFCRLFLLPVLSSSPISREVVEKKYSTVESLESYMQRKLFPKILTVKFLEDFCMSNPKQSIS